MSLCFGYPYKGRAGPQRLRGALVSVLGTTVATDDRGHVAFNDICSGSLLIKAEHPAFAAASRAVILSENCAGRTVVELEMDAVFEQMEVQEVAVVTEDTRSVTELSGEALVKKRGLSLADAIADVPGVAQMGSGTSTAKPIVRGHFGRRVPLLVDGVRHRSQDWGIDHAPEVDPNLAGRVTVLRGPRGSKTGQTPSVGRCLWTRFRCRPKLARPPRPT